jgi:hypothetical protein
MIYIIYDSGVLSLHFPRKKIVLSALDISLCDRGLIFHKNNNRSDYVFNSGI